MADIVNDSEYRSWLRGLKQQIKTEQVKAGLSVNTQMIMLYWDLGRQITEKQETAKWGSGLIELLSKDLMSGFPEMTGFSRTNLFRMKKFYQFYSSIVPINEFVPQAGGQLQAIDNKENIANSRIEGNVVIGKIIMIPWRHHVSIFEKVKDIKQALFYIDKTIENNWSRTILEYQIEINLYERQGKAVTNFKQTLPEPQSDLANAIMKEPYNFEFLRLAEKVKETDLENALVRHIAQFLLELGIGFAYMGQQFPLKVGKKEYRTDLLFYHTRLKCYIIIELKSKEFEPEYVGKLNFYITAVNELVKDDTDKPTIGMLLCRNRDSYEVEFSLKGVNNPIGVGTFKYTELADDIKGALPSAEELQSELLNFEREHGS